MTRRLKIMHHDHCFDGAASASLFARFYAERVEGGAEIVYAGKAHARGVVFHDSEFDADEHVVVDFRYATNPRLTWWFDHHASAFQPPTEEADFRQRPPDRFFYDPLARSCTKFLAESLGRVYGWDSSRYAELIHWADLIDGAKFESAEQATRLAEPALKVMSFIEHNQDKQRAREVIEALTSRPLADLAQERYITTSLVPVQKLQLHAASVLRARISTTHGVAFFDISDDESIRYSKFLPYVLAPQAHYVVAVSRGDERSKVSVGMNPWNPPKPLTHIARICERYGGGGHAVVGAVTIDGPSDSAVTEARRIADEITAELRATHTGKER